MADTLFGLNPGDKQEDQTTDQTQTVTDYLGQYVGEDKKYKDEMELAKAYANADQFITQLKAENEALVRQMGERESQEKLVEEVMAKLGGTDTLPVDDHIVTQPTDNTSLTKDEIAKLVEQQITQKSQAEIERANALKAKQLLVSSFGSETAAHQAIEKYIAGDPAKQQMIQDIGKRDPEAVVRILGQVPTVNSPTSGSTVNMGGLGWKPKITWTDAIKLRKENPEAYKKMQPELMAIATEAKAKGINYYET